MEKKNNIKEAYILCSQEEYQKFMDDVGEKLIHAIMKNYGIRGTEQADVYQEACLVTAHALACYDPIRLDVKVTTYVWHCVENVAKMHIRAQMAQKNNASYGVVSYEDVVAQELSQPEEAHPINNYRPTITTDEHFHNQSAAKELLKSMMNEASLTKTHKSIIRFMLAGLSQNDIGKKLGMSQSKVSKLFTEAKGILLNTKAAQAAMA